MNYYHSLTNKTLVATSNLEFIYKWLIAILLVFSFTFGYNQFWLVYDTFIITLLFKIQFKKIAYNNPLLLLFGSFLLIFFIFSLRNGIRFINFLSFWDTIKHLFLIIFLLQNKQSLAILNTTWHLKKIYRLLLGLFIFNLFFISYQYKVFLEVGGRYDNISGSFGDGSTHAVGLFCIATLDLALHLKKFKQLLLLLPFSILINYWGQNEGFYVLLSLIIFKHLSLFIIEQKKKIRFSTTKLTIIITIIGIIFFNLGTEKTSEYIDKVYSKILTSIPMLAKNIDKTGYVTEYDFKSTEYLRLSRKTMLDYAVYLGEYTGAGFGAYSIIYGKEGWQIPYLINSQINISEGSHLLAEVGIIGTTVIVLVFFIAIINILLRKFIWWLIFFIVCFLYVRILMDERLIFFYILMLYFEIIIRNRNKWHIFIF